MKKMTMPKTGKAQKPHIRMRHLKTVAPSAFPPSPMAFPPPADPSAGGAPSMPPQDPTSAMASPATAGAPASGMMGQ